VSAAALARRLAAVERRRMGAGGGPLARFSDADLLGATEWACERLAEAGVASAMATLAREDAEEARLKAFHTRPDIAAACRLGIEDGVRWPHQRASALWREREHPGSGPRSARDAGELTRKIGAAMATLRRAR
jgi:hypothetical protein